LRRLTALTFVSCAATVDLTGANRLLTGDFQAGVVSQDGLVDITDFSILAARFNTAIDATLSTGADATGDGVQGTADFTAMQVNFLAIGEALDGCGARSSSGESTPFVVGVDGASLLPVAPRISVPVSELRIPGAEEADLTGNGIVDVGDIRAFARRHNLPLSPDFEERVGKPTRKRAGRTRR
jgi:hypothetical protein